MATNSFSWESLPAISIIMPCLNEAQNIASALTGSLEFLSEKKLNGEIIVVNDGSTDESQNIIEKFQTADSRVRVIKKIRNEGIGRAFFDGVDEARHPFVVLIPGDNENSAAEVFTFYYLVRDVDIVVPFILNTEVRNKVRRFVSSAYRFIVNMTFGTSLNYTNGMVIYNKKALDVIHFNTSGFFYQTEILIKLLRRGFLYAEVPQFLSPRRGGKSKALTMASFFSLTHSFLRLIIDIHLRRVEGSRRHTQIPPVGTSTRRKLDQIKADNGN